MSHVRRVLACTDFSPAAGYPVDRATLLCRDTGAALELFHAVNLSGLNGCDGPLRASRTGWGSGPSMINVRRSHSWARA